MDCQRAGNMAEEPRLGPIACSEKRQHGGAEGGDGRIRRAIGAAKAAWPEGSAGRLKHWSADIEAQGINPPIAANGQGLAEVLDAYAAGLGGGMLQPFALPDHVQHVAWLEIEHDHVGRAAGQGGKAAQGRAGAAKTSDGEARPWRVCQQQAGRLADPEALGEILPVGANLGLRRPVL